MGNSGVRTVLRIENSERLVKVATDAFDKHMIVIRTAKSVSIQFEEPRCVTECIVKFTILIQDHRMEESVSELKAHDGCNVLEYGYVTPSSRPNAVMLQAPTI